MQSIFIRILSIVTAFLIKLFWLGNIKGLSNIPASPCVIISNHESYLDFLLLGYTLKRKAGKSFRFWAKTKVVNHSIWKTYSTFFNSIEVNGNFRKLNELSLEALNSGEYVCIFPEGQRSRNGDLQPFKEGYLRLASSAGIEVVPAFIENTYQTWPAHKRLPGLRKCNVSFHPSFKISRDLTESEIAAVNLMIMKKYSEFRMQSRNQ